MSVLLDPPASKSGAAAFEAEAATREIHCVFTGSEWATVLQAVLEAKKSPFFEGRHVDLEFARRALLALAHGRSRGMAGEV